MTNECIQTHNLLTEITIWIVIRAQPNLKDIRQRFVIEAQNMNDFKFLLYQYNNILAEYLSYLRYKLGVKINL